jgi:hypothetical protein
MYGLKSDIPIWQEDSVEKEDLGRHLMEEPFNPSDIDIDTKSPTLSLLITRLKSDPSEIDLYPDFQRKDDLWDEGKQSRLIESILISFPLPAFYFDGTDDDKWLVVDGLQRLSALRNFTINKTLKLQDLEFLKDLENKRFDDLPRSLQRKIEETQIVAYIIKPGTPPKVKYNIFRRINTGGLVLEPQEIRHALNQGTPAKFVAKLADSDMFKKATENKISTVRMQDREFITRFIAFYLTDPEAYYPDLDTFLNDAMALLATLSLEKLNTIRDDFVKAMKLSKNIFGKWAFRKADLYPHKRKPINKALFEVWSVTLSKLSDEERDQVLLKRKELMESFIKLLRNDSKFVRSVTSGTGGKTEVLERFYKIRMLINQIK